MLDDEIVIKVQNAEQKDEDDKLGDYEGYNSSWHNETFNCFDNRIPS